jgi:hypothetical protein
MNPGHALTFTKGNEKKNIPRKPILPTPEEVAMLRRIARGYAKLTFTEKGPQYAYDDGTPLPLRRPKRDPHGKLHFDRMVENRWLVGDKDSLMEDGTPQIYRARKP